MTLNSLNYATLPPETTSSNSDEEVSVSDLGEAINYEAALAADGYNTEVPNEFNESGWPAVPYRVRDGRTEAYEPR